MPGGRISDLRGSRARTPTIRRRQGRFCNWGALIGERVLDRDRQAVEWTPPPARSQSLVRLSCAGDGLAPKPADDCVDRRVVRSTLRSVTSSHSAAEISLWRIASADSTAVANAGSTLTQWSSRLGVRRLRGELLHPLRLTLLHFLGRQIFLVRRDRPPVPVRVSEGSGAIAPELIRHGPHGAPLNLRARRDRAVEQCIAILDVHPERRR